MKKLLQFLHASIIKKLYKLIWIYASHYLPVVGSLFTVECKGLKRTTSLEATWIWLKVPSPSTAFLPFLSLFEELSVCWLSSNDLFKVFPRQKPRRMNKIFKKQTNITGARRFPVDKCRVEVCRVINTGTIFPGYEVCRVRYLPGRH